MNTLNHNVFAVRNKEAFHDVISSGNYGLVEMQVATVANKAYVLLTSSAPPLKPASLGSGFVECSKP